MSPLSSGIAEYVIILCGLVGLFGSGWARASSSTPGSAASESGARDGALEPRDALSDSLVPEAGSVVLHLVTEINASRYLGFDPVSLAPDLYVGMGKGLSLGLTHSFRSLDLYDSGNGFCLVGEGPRCARAYDNVGLEARFRLLTGRRLELVGQLRFQARTLEPLKLSLRPGVILQFAMDRYILTTSPHLSIGLTHVAEGNRHALSIPLTLEVHVCSRIRLELLSGIHGPWMIFSDAYVIPVGMGGRMWLSEGLELEVVAAFSQLLGPLNTASKRQVRWVLTHQW